MVKRFWSKLSNRVKGITLLTLCFLLFMSMVAVTSGIATAIAVFIGLIFIAAIIALGVYGLILLMD